MTTYHNKSSVVSEISANAIIHLYSWLIEINILNSKPTLELKIYYYKAKFKISLLSKNLFKLEPTKQLSWHMLIWENKNTKHIINFLKILSFKVLKRPNYLFPTILSWFLYGPPSSRYLSSSCVSPPSSTNNPTLLKMKKTEKFQTPIKMVTTAYHVLK